MSDAVVHRTPLRWMRWQGGAGLWTMPLATALACLALLLPSVPAWLIDPRTLDGVSVWAKPIKFQLSFALHWLTVVWLLRWLDPVAARDNGLRRWLLVGGWATVIEVLYISLQGARGRASHFNVSTWWEGVLYYGLMGGAAVLMVLATLAVGLWIWCHPREGRRDAAWLGAVIGLVWGSALTLLVTAPLAAGVIDGPGPWVGGTRSNADGLPLLHWSTTGGDLRIPHFFATHLMQAVPLAGWALVQRGAPWARAGVWLAALCMTGLVGYTLARAISGLPPWP